MRIIKLVQHFYFLPVVIFIFFSCLYFSSTVGGMNSEDGSEFALTQAIVEKKSVAIDNFVYWTYFTDYAHEKNHYYLDREPGTSFLAIPFYSIAKLVAPYGIPPYNFQNKVVDYYSILQAFTYLTSVFFGAFGIILVYLICIDMGASKLSSLITATVAGAGTLMWKYSASFYREPVYTTCLLLSILLLFKAIKTKKKKEEVLLILLGLSFGISIFVDYSKIYLLPLFLLGILFFFKLKKFKKILIFGVGFMIPLIIIFWYNYSTFGNPFTNPHLHKGYLIWMRNPANLFKSPLIPSVVTNLFSFKPINPSLLQFYYDNPYIAYQNGAHWATVWIYKGIIIQSPVLIIAMLGWLMALRKYFHRSLFILITSMLILLINSKLTNFWASNIYDTRYFLSTAVLLLLGFSFFLDFVFHIKNILLKFINLFSIFILSTISIAEGWLSNITNFAPHVTGEHRFSFDSLYQPFFMHGNFSKNISILFFNSFPNIYNLHLLFLVYFLPVVFIFCLYYFFLNLTSSTRYTNNKIKKIINKSHFRKT